MAPGTVPARISHIVPFVDDDEFLDWDCCLDSLPPPIAQGTITVELTPKNLSDQKPA